jgi:tetratricopeptide (TPR) repeat protein
VLPPESLVDGLAQDLLTQPGQASRALALFQLNLQNYPTSANAHVGLGDYYQAQKQPALAIAAYTRALQLQETPATRQKLAQLQGKK